MDELKNSPRVILTPNHREFKRLYQRVFPDEQFDEKLIEAHAKNLASNLGVNVFCKGVQDIITDGNEGLLFWSLMFADCFI